MTDVANGTCYTLGRSQDFSLGGAQVERQRIEAPRAPRMVGCGEGVSSSTLRVGFNSDFSCILGSI